MHSDLAVLAPPDCSLVVPLEGFPEALLQAKLEFSRSWFSAMRGTKHDHIDGYVAELSWRRRGYPGNPRLSPWTDMLEDIAANY